MFKRENAAYIYLLQQEFEIVINSLNFCSEISKTGI